MSKWLREELKRVELESEIRLHRMRGTDRLREGLEQMKRATADEDFIDDLNKLLEGE